jgi:hypothetical protein
MAFDMISQETISDLDKNVDVEINDMFNAQDGNWQKHAENVSRLVAQRVAMTEPDVFARIEELLRKRA